MADAKALTSNHLQTSDEYYDMYAVVAKRNGLHSSGRPPASIRRAKRLNPGAVKSAGNLATFVREARQLETKGVVWNRGRHKLASKFSEWVQNQPEDGFRAFAKETQQVILEESTVPHLHDVDGTCCEPYRKKTEARSHN